MITILCIVLCVIGAFNWFSVGVFDFNFVNWIFQGNYYIGAQIIYGLIGVAGLYLVAYLIYNKFSGLNIHAPECMWRKRRNEQKQLGKENGRGDIVEKHS